MAVKGRDWKGKGREDTREDELLRPEGLGATLMPFQSRSVRWLLAREGKRVRPGAVEGDGEEGEMMEEESVPGVLEHLEEDELRSLWRGPLWEKVRLETEGEETEFWLNRVAGRLSVVDPLDLAEGQEVSFVRCAGRSGSLSVAGGRSRRGIWRRSAQRRDGTRQVADGPQPHPSTCVLLRLRSLLY